MTIPGGDCRISEASTVWDKDASKIKIWRQNRFIPKKQEDNQN